MKYIPLKNYLFDNNKNLFIKILHGSGVVHKVRRLTIFGVSIYTIGIIVAIKFGEIELVKNIMMYLFASIAPAIGLVGYLAQKKMMKITTLWVSIYKNHKELDNESISIVEQILMKKLNKSKL